MIKPEKHARVDVFQSTFILLEDLGDGAWLAVDVAPFPNGRGCHLIRVADMTVRTKTEDGEAQVPLSEADIEEVPPPLPQPPEHA